MDIAELRETRPTGRFSFDCPVCHKLVEEELILPEARFSADEADDGASGEDIDVRCEHCGTWFSVNLVAMPFEVRGKISRYPSVPVQIEHYADDDDYDYLEPADDPFSVFQVATATLLAHLEDYRPRMTSDVSFYHMIFTQLFSAWEAYLADQLISLALGDDNARARLLARADGLSTLAFKLIEIEKRPSLVTDSVKTTLRQVSYHDLKKVSSLYDIAFGKPVFDGLTPSVRQLLQEAVPKRHDCVHRNGRDIEGMVRVEIDESYVLSIAHAMRTAAFHIEMTRPNRPPDDDFLDDFPF